MSVQLISLEALLDIILGTLESYITEQIAIGELSAGELVQIVHYGLMYW